MFFNKPLKFLKKNAGKWISINKIAKELKLTKKYISEKLNNYTNEAFLYFRPKGNDLEFMYVDV